MFERYTETARKAIFWALHQAYEARSSSIETDQLLAGLLRADPALAQRWPQLIPFTSASTAGAAWPRTLEPVPRRDLPLSHESKRVLAYAAEEGERLAHRHIGTEHVLLGLLREPDSRAGQALRQAGLELTALREQLAKLTSNVSAEAKAGEQDVHRKEQLRRMIDELPPELCGAAEDALRAIQDGAAIIVRGRVAAAGTSYTSNMPYGREVHGMFERYTESARRAVFFARYEASAFGSNAIESEHLLLGLLREHTLARSLLGGSEAIQAVRKEIESRTQIGPKVSTSVDLPLSEECKHALELAAEEAGNLGHSGIRVGHLLLGLVLVEGSLVAEMLVKRGVTAERVRAFLAGPA
jgi:ATP-dependent Clp protease ATP-binding subunit ClpA